ncbi:MAG: alpha-L-rhamnosidase C-terminal domain-containing protein [Sphingobacterium composti]|uniref:alpha-L-rhamnosidase-related protein n=1 Tax=Sphingobacterium composti TaxID=363260 RepID=UPI00135CAC28|nr:alpha-L-rhamnosidase C-terminal domain-containing protein [Sphingobacterium composti Ten et al. 2007 non Yoo et al. 2007]
MQSNLIFSILLLSIFSVCQAQTKKLSDQYTELSALTSAYVYPTRVVWKEGNITNEKYLLQKGNGQANLYNPHSVVLKNEGNTSSSILLDFGKQMNASIEVVTGMWGGNNLPKNVRVRFGESVSEAMSEIGEKGATNDHAVRDFSLPLPWLGKNRSGESGFRFVRIDFLEPNSELHLRELRAVATFRDVPYVGTFKSSNERLNSIWNVGAYTVHVNMQDYLWDGIKRDRLVWVGDLHPEVATVNTVFGYNEVVPKSLDLARDATPLPGWMSGHSSYSMWWIILHYDWYMHHGNKEYLREQIPYLKDLVKQIISKVDKGTEKMDGARFLDWPSSDDKIAVHAGLQAMTIMSLEKASFILNLFGESQAKELSDKTIAEMKKVTPPHNSSKQAAALMSLVGLMDADKAYKDVLAVGGAQKFSTFYGYYMLEAMAKAGKYQEAMNIISEYWGAMLDLGATTFWEDFNMDWIPNASRIDELVPEGKVDIHGDYGAYCYVGHRHSLCHGWASGPTAWLSEHVLGVKVVEPGGRTYKITPNLGDLEWVEGTFPTTYGPIYIQHKRQGNKIISDIKAPKEVKIIR